MLVIGASIAVLLPLPTPNRPEFRFSDFSRVADVEVDSVEDSVTVSGDLPTLRMTAEELLQVLLSSLVIVVSSSDFISAITLAANVDLSAEHDRGRPAVAVDALLLISSRSVELDLFLANFNIFEYH